MKKLQLKIQKEDIFDVIKCILIAIIISILLVVLFSIIVKFAELGSTGISIGNIVIKIVSVLAACLIGMKTASKGALKGIFVGLLFVVLSFLVFSAINGKFEAGSLTFFDVLFVTIAGGVSGIIAVNIRSKK